MKIIELLDLHDPKNNELLAATDKLIEELVISANNQNFPVQECYNMYRQKISELHESEFKMFNVKLNHQQVNNQSVSTVIGRNSKNLVNFTESTFVNGALFVISILIHKYPGKISVGMAKLAMLKLLFDNGMLWQIHENFDEHKEFVRKAIWHDIVRVHLTSYIDEVLSSDIAKLTVFTDKKGKTTSGLEAQLNSAATNNRQILIGRPTCQKHLTDLWTEDMDRPTCVKVLAEAYDVSIRQARNWMHEFGLWETQVRIDYQKLYNESIETIEKLTSEIDSLSNQLAESQKRCLALKKEVEELKNKGALMKTEYDRVNIDSLTLNKQINLF